MAPLDESLQLSVANICLEKGWFVFPLLARRKEPDPEFSPNGFKSASNDPAQIHEWWTKKPSANIGIDLGRSNLTVLDFDKGEPPAELNLPETLRVKTSRGTHVYLRGISEQKKMFFQGQHIGEIKSEGGYVLGPASAHPDGTIYEVVLKAPVAPIPEGLIEKLTTAPKEVHDDTPRDAAGKVPHGSIHLWALTQAGKLRNLGLDLDMLEPALLKLVHEQCAAPIDENKIRTLARSVCGSWPAGQSTDIVLTQNAQTITQTTEVENLPAFEDTPYPRFPKYVLEGTSLYKGFVEPVCSVNSRIDYFMWYPAVQIMLNFLGGKVRVKDKSIIPSLYSVLIGKKGRTKKSTCMDEAINYFNYAGVAAHASRDIKNAEGKTLIWTAGSPEGLGIDAQRTSCKNLILLYDEFSMLANKVGIESSNLGQALLLLYESKKFANSVKSTKESYSLEPNTYCFSLMAGNTAKDFAEIWSKLATGKEGMDDRFTFILEPLVLPESKPFHYVNTGAGAIETKKLIDKALIKGVYEIESQEALQKGLSWMSDREEIRAEKYALYFAVDLGRDTIDDDAIERAISLVEYEKKVKGYLKSYEATTREGEIQQNIRRILEMSKGRMLKRDLLRKINYDRFGTSLWNQAYGGLKNNRIIREEGTGVRNDPEFVQLLIKRETDDE
jgi:hypothetical protein